MCIRKTNSFETNMNEVKKKNEVEKKATEENLNKIRKVRIKMCQRNSPFSSAKRPSKQFYNRGQNLIKQRKFFCHFFNYVTN